MKPSFLLLFLVMLAPFACLGQSKEYREIETPDPPKHHITIVPEEVEIVQMDLNAASPFFLSHNLDSIRAVIGYPSVAREYEIQGKVTMLVTIDNNGRYVRHDLVRTAHKVLSDAVERAIINIRFEAPNPASNPPLTSFTLPFDFVLK